MLVSFCFGKRRNFPTQVDENFEDYEYLLDPRKRENTLSDSESHNIGPNHFIFRPYKTEKERIKVSFCFDLLPLELK